MIKLLIETGADKKAQDSQGRSAFEYLEMNEQLTENEMVLAQRLLS